MRLTVRRIFCCFWLLYKMFWLLFPIFFTFDFSWCDTCKAAKKLGKTFCLLLSNITVLTFLRRDTLWGNESANFVAPDNLLGSFDYYCEKRVVLFFLSLLKSKGTVERTPRRREPCRSRQPFGTFWLLLRKMGNFHFLRLLGSERGS